MPLDTNDYEKLQIMFDKLDMRIQANLKELMPRQEYEQRHRLMIERIDRIDGQNTQITTFAMAEHDKLRTLIEARFDVSMEAVKEVGKQADEIKAQLAQSQGATLRYVVSVIVSFVIGGGAIGIYEFIARGGK